LKFALCLLTPLLLFGQPALDRQVRERVAGFEGKVSIFAKNLKTGATYDLGGDTRVNTASTIKLPIMIGVYTAVADGRVHWTDTSTLTKAVKVGGSGVIQELSEGRDYPLRDLMRLMILLSDNTATNLVLDHVTGDQVNETMKKLGIEHTRSLRKILNGSKPEGVSAAGRDPANAGFGIGVATPREMVSLLERLYRGEIVGKEASAEMLDLMKKQMWRDGMSRRFASDIDVADKPGALDHLRSDVGIVFAKTAPVAIAITCSDMPKPDWSPDNPGYLLIADVSRILVAGLGGN
jgi:beta-lactamase class A